MGKSAEIYTRSRFGSAYNRWNNCKSHACSAGYKKDSRAQEALGRSKGGFTTKIHALVDGLGNSLKFILTAGQRHDITQAEALTENVSNSTLVADKGYDSNVFIANLENKGCTVVIPPKRNRKEQRDYDKRLYKERHLSNASLRR